MVQSSSRRTDTYILVERAFAMDAHPEPDVCDDDGTAVTVPHQSTGNESECPLADSVAAISLNAADNDEEREQEALSLDDAAVELPVSLHLPGADLESIKHGLDSVVFDIWQASILPMLSIPDIFQLCGTTRKLRLLLFDEYTFKRLCQVSVNV